MKYLLLISFSVFVSSAKANQGSDTLNILISAKNNIFYYVSPMSEDASNFKAATTRGINDVIRMERHEAKEKGDSLVVLLKVQNQDSLNEKLKNTVLSIKEQPHYMEGKLTQLEEILIKATEDAQDD